MVVTSFLKNNFQFFWFIGKFFVHLQKLNRNYMERISAKYQIDIEKERHLQSLDYKKDIINDEMVYQLSKEIAKTIEIKKVENRYIDNVEYSTEFYIMQVSELQTIMNCLSKIRSRTDNHLVIEALRKIANILNDVK